MLAKRVNHFDRKKNLIFDFFVLGFLSQTVGKRSRLSTPFPKKEKKIIWAELRNNLLPTSNCAN